jgi:ankyrin repeat protein
MAEAGNDAGARQCMRDQLHRTGNDEIIPAGLARADHAAGQHAPFGPGFDPARRRRHQLRCAGIGLHYAGTYQMVELARAMLDAGGDRRPKDRFGNTPLRSAVVHPKRYLELVDMLMRHGADPHSKNKAGRSPLDFTRQIGSEPLIALLSIPAAAPPRPASIGAAARPASGSAASKSWQEEFDRLWDELVPSSGQADTVQCELVRAIGRLSDEAYRNGNGNWDEGYRLLAEYLMRRHGLFGRRMPGNQSPDRSHAGL